MNASVTQPKSIPCHYSMEAYNTTEFDIDKLTECNYLDLSLDTIFLYIDHL